MKTFCQWMMLVWLALTFLSCLHGDFNGSKGKEPPGFAGAIVTIAIVGALLALLYGAGGLDRIF